MDSSLLNNLVYQHILKTSGEKLAKKFLKETGFEPETEENVPELSKIVEDFLAHEETMEEKTFQQKPKFEPKKRKNFDEENNGFQPKKKYKHELPK